METTSVIAHLNRKRLQGRINAHTYTKFLIRKRHQQLHIFTQSCLKYLVSEQRCVGTVVFLLIPANFYLFTTVAIQKGEKLFKNYNKDTRTTPVLCCLCC